MIVKCLKWNKNEKNIGHLVYNLGFRYKIKTKSRRRDLLESTFNVYVFAQVLTEKLITLLTMVQIRLNPLPDKRPVPNGHAVYYKSSIVWAPVAVYRDKLKYFYARLITCYVML